MKKFLTLILSVTLSSAVLLSACSSTTVDTPVKDEDTVATDAGGVVHLVSDGSSINKENIEDFEEFINSADKPVFVDFWAEWCGPCVKAAPTVEEMATEFDGKAYIVKVDVDTDMGDELASKYDVTGIPLFTVIKDGEVVDSATGYGPNSPEQLKELLSNAID